MSFGCFDYKNTPRSGLFNNSTIIDLPCMQGSAPLEVRITILRGKLTAGHLKVLFDFGSFPLRRSWIQSRWGNAVQGVAWTASLAFGVNG
jgi:hypothetical protein